MGKNPEIFYRGVIKADPRHTTRRMLAATRKDPIRALVELVLNSHDSYVRLEAEKVLCNGKIEIEYTRKDNTGYFTIRDFAEGMSIKNIGINFGAYGGDTSGMSEGKKVRGYFGQGAKDALASMHEGCICTFKDDIYTECHIFIEEGKTICEILQPKPVSGDLRKKHKINKNGTVAYFQITRDMFIHLPQPNKVFESVSNCYQLRKLLVHPNRKIIFIDGKDRKPVTYRNPAGKEIMNERFVISLDGFGDFKCNMRLCRANFALTQAGDDRHGGLLILDECDAVLDISLFKFNLEPLAEHFFGEVSIDRFRYLLKKNEPVLSEERDGLIGYHPFCKELISQIESRLDVKIKEEKERKKNEGDALIDHEERKRFAKGMNFLNHIALEEAGDIMPFGNLETDNIQDPPNGFCMYPEVYTVTVKKKGNLRLYIDTKKIKVGSKVKVHCPDKAINVITSEIIVTDDDKIGDTNIIIKYITIEAKNRTSPEGCIITASIGKISSRSVLTVIPEEKNADLYSLGLVFEPEEMVVQPGKVRRATLKVYTKIVSDGNTIKIEVEKNRPNITVSPDKITVNELDAVKGIASYDVEVLGTGDGEDGFIYATYIEPHNVVGMHVKIRSKDVQPIKGVGGMFSQPEYDYEPNPVNPTAYSSDTGKIKIYVNWPNTKFILGDLCKYRKTPAAQILIASLVLEKAFIEIARKKIMTMSMNKSAIEAGIHMEANQLAQKNSGRFFEILIDQKLLSEEREYFKNRKD
jgi:hypothetical protein